MLEKPLHKSDPGAYFQQELGLNDLVPLTGGRTNLVWRSGDVVLKLYQPGAATPLFPNRAEDEWRLLEALKGFDLAPRPRHRGPSPFGDWVIYDRVIGETSVADLGALARLLHKVHSIPAPAGLAAAETGDEVIVQGLAMGGENPPPPPPAADTLCLIHRDPVPTNVVSGPTGLRLLDWQCPALGDPAEDLAHALSPAMQVLYAGAPLSMAERQAFLQAYPDPSVVTRYRAGADAWHWRMAAYCQWQVARGQEAYALALEAERELLAVLTA